MSLAWRIGNSGLSPGLRFTLLMLASFGYEGRNVRPALATVARMVGRSERQVRRDVAALVALGVLVPAGARVGGRGRPTVYSVALEALPKPGHPAAEDPQNPDIDPRNPDMGVRVSADAGDLGPKPADQNPDIGVRVSSGNPDIGVRVSGLNPDMGVRGTKIKITDQDHKSTAAPATLSLWEVRTHVQAAVFRMLEAGGRYLEADGSPALAEITAEAATIAGRHLRAEWSTSRELASMVDGAVGAWGRMSAARGKRRRFLAGEARALEALGAVR